MASNEEEPMETNVEDVAELKVRLTTADEIEPKKFKFAITKTLQSWANKNSIDGEFTATKISDDGKQAVISVTPAHALQELLNLSGKELYTRDKKAFYLSPIEEQDQDVHKFTGVDSSLAQALNGSVGVSDEDCPVNDDSDKPFLVALGPYWYMKNIYPERIQHIEEDNGVKITENVAVAINADKKSANPKKASDEFIKLVQSCCDECGNVSIPLKKVGPEEWKNTLTFLKTTDRKCQITITSDEIKIFGPLQYQVALSKSLQSTKITTDFADHEKMDYNEKYNTKTTTNFTDEERVKGQFGRDSTRRQESHFAKDRKSPIRMKVTSSIKDPLVIDGLLIEDHYWEMINGQYQSEFNGIQEKFNVRFRESADGTKGKKIKVQYKKSEGNVQMESHAIRALLRLYQRVVLPKLKQTNGSIDEDNNVDLYNVSDEPYGAMGKTSVDRKDKTKRSEEENDKKPRGAEAKKEEEEEEKCPVCMDKFTKKKTLPKCKHEFCEECLERSIKSLGATCPVCKDVFGLMEGDQPDGTMTWHTQSTRLPGFNHFGTIQINYNIPSGKQTSKHPNPGRLYHGTVRTAYLPDNREGNEVLMLLKKAFDQKLIFTVGTSRTSGADNAVTWNDIHHKTSTYGGPENYGYPDPDYLDRVKDELKAKGIK